MKNAATAQQVAISATDIATPIANELTELSMCCSEIQETLSRVLDLVHHPEVEREFHILQDIDRIQQTLTDLSGLMIALAPHLSDTICDREQFIDQVKLQSLAKKLFPKATDANCEAQPQASSSESSQITLF